MEPTRKYFDSNLFFPQKLLSKAISDNIYEGGVHTKCRSIQIIDTSDPLRSSDGIRENACGVKEVKNIGSMMRSNYYANRKPVLGSKSVSGLPKQLSKLDTATVLKAIQRKLHSSYHGSIYRMRQGSLSEPNLAVVKDRGDSVPFQDTYKDENVPVSYFGDCKKLQPENRSLKARFYVKKGGKFYVSKVEAVKFQADAGDVFHDEPKKHKYGKNEANISKLDNENDDFEISILLSGIKNFGRQKRQEDDKYKEKKPNVRIIGKGKKELDIRRTKDKRFGVARKSFCMPLKMVEINQPNNDSCSGLTYTVRKSGIDLDFSSKESDSEYEYDESENIVKRRGKGALHRVSENWKDATKTNKSDNMGSLYKSTRTSLEKTRSKVSQSSASQCSDIYRLPKLKISDATLWGKFEIIFRNYASTSRHSGEVIPRKISTMWMMNAGVVDELLTEKEADDAFRNAAGAKITMNTQEYKGFLIRLSLRLKLPYYEIYRRMCGL